MSKVLIIEDNVDLSNLFQMVLDIHGISSEICRDGRDAAGAIDSVRPQVVVLDMHLPHVSGASIFEHIKKDHPEIAVLIVTADRDLYSEYRNKSFGALDVFDNFVLRDRQRHGADTNLLIHDRFFKVKNFNTVFKKTGYNDFIMFQP